MKALPLLLALGVGGWCVPVLCAETPAVGQKAPLVEGKDENGKTWKLADSVGKKVVLLYFYPKDDTPGCTKEACGLRDRMSDLQKDGVEVVGVSLDSVESHLKFREKYNLNFSLLADTEGKITDAYGARMPDRPMARRVSFLIGQDGNIAHVTDNRDAQVHLDEMGAAINELKAAPGNYRFNVGTLKPQPFVSIRGKSKVAEIGETIGGWYGELGQFLGQRSLEMDGRPIGRFYSFDAEEADMEAILPVARKVESAGRIQAGELPGGEAVSTIHVGPYEQSGQAWAALENWIRENGREPAGTGWVVYLNDPATVSDPAKFRSRLVRPLKPK